MTVLSTLPTGIRSYLDDFVVRRRRVALARAAGIGLAAFLVWMLGWCLLDRFTQLPAGVRLAALLVGAVAAAARLAPALLALHRRIDCVAAAEAVERQDARFGQRLVTVTSRLLGAAEYRGSDDILIRLVREVGEQVAVARSHRLIPVRPVLGPWAVCLVLALLGCGLMRVPGLGMPALISRFFNPMADIPPVTTTHLTVSPGNRDLVQSHPVSIEVQAEQLGEPPVMLHLSDDGRNWARIAMSAGAGSRFSFSLASVDRDLRYYVTGGDARSPQYMLRVLRRPAVASFRIDYEFPAYTRLPAARVVNTDGRIEAPAGTKVTLVLSASEPLKAALLSVNGERLLMDQQQQDDRSARARFVVRSSGPYAVDLISARGVPGGGPPGTTVRAVPDLPPKVRLARGGETLQLAPRDSAAVWYEALDDYGLQSLVMRAQVNGDAPVDKPLTLWGDPRRQQDAFHLDLAAFPALVIGDVVKLSAIATDTAGHVAVSLPLQVIVSPSSVDPDARERIAELRNAAQLAQSLAAQFDDAVRAQDEMQRQKDPASGAYLSAESKADRALSSASQTATLLRQSLLRATTHSQSSRLAVALAGWVDASEVSSSAADQAFREGAAPGGMPRPVRERLRAASDQVGQLRLQLATIATGEQATAALADLENLDAARRRPMPTDEAGRRRLREALNRMRQDVAQETGLVGVDAKSNDVKDRLRARTRESDAVLASAHPVDFVAACRQWARQAQADPQQRLGMESRLAAAAQAEAIRPDADLFRAQDLELASRAAGAVSAIARSGPAQSTSKSFERLIADLEAMQKARETDKNRSAPGSDAGVRHARDAAAAARQDLIALAGEPVATPTSALTSTGPHGGGNTGMDERQKAAEALALQASAAAASHQYGQAARIDGSLLRRLEGAPPQHREATTTLVAETEASPSLPADRVEHHRQSVQRDMATAQQLDALGRAQQALSEPAATTEPAQAADQQLNVAERIAQVATQSRDGTASFVMSENNGRDRAASEVLGAQEQLSSMPQALAAAQSAAGARREAAMRAAMARATAQAAPPDQRDAADRASAEADRNAADAHDRVDQAVMSLSPTVAEQMAQRLAPFAPETDAAQAAILSQLAPALETFGTAVEGSDAGFVDRSATDVRRAVEACQRELSEAQDALLQRDPLMAAKWYAREAANSLSMMPPDFGSARAHQANASAAIWRAWDQSIHRAATERLSAIPSMAMVMGPPAPAGAGTTASQQGSRFAAAREWGRLRPQDAPEINAALHDADPPGYEESLKLYFEGLGKAQGGK